MMSDATPTDQICKTAQDQDGQVKLTIIIEWGALPARAVCDLVSAARCLRKADSPQTIPFRLVFQGNTGLMAASIATAWTKKCRRTLPR